MDMSSFRNILIANTSGTAWYEPTRLQFEQSICILVQKEDDGRTDVSK